MAEPLIASLATKLAAQVVKASAPRLKERVLGSDEQRAFSQALQRAFAATLTETDRGGAAPGDLEGQLSEYFGAPEVAGALVDVALERRAPNLPELADRLWLLGFDASTFPIDLVAIVSTLAEELAREIRSDARRSESVLFNEVVLSELDALRRDIRQAGGPAGGALRGGAPPAPSLMIGRNAALRELKQRLGIGDAEAMKVVTAVRGWPGVGKTTVAAALAHDAELRERFPDGVLWATMARREALTSELLGWARALGLPGAATAAELGDAVRAALLDKRVLIVLDDVWDAADVLPFRVAGPQSATLVTTRLPAVARALAPTAADVYTLDVLDEGDSLALLASLAPEVVAAHPDEARDLIREMEGLPLALQVAGHLLQAEAALGLGVTELLRELRSGVALLDAEVPLDRRDVEEAATPTVAVLLAHSTDRLDPGERERFAILGAFAPKPAAFDLAALGAVWDMEDPRPTIRRLVERGLLEPRGEGRFQMHALLVAHAASLLDD